MAWWREARLGMFIHWGLYAIPAGHWDGKPHGGIGEWIMNSADIPVDRYEQLADQFDPVRYDPQQWVQIAKQAGMKYIVITSKHHDGFCLFDTAATDWDVVDRTPYKKDLLAPLAEECRKADIKFCVYYSIMDWHHPAQSHGESHYNPTLIKPERKQDYVDFMKQQLAELIKICDPEVLWFDGEWVGWWTEEDGRDLYNFVRGLKPEIIINNRVGKGRKGMEGLTKDDQQYAGDFGTPEQEIPATGLPGVDWESCMTMNDTWGYKRDDQNWKSSQALIRNLIDIASKGGNYLLNVGPTAAGEIPAASVERLAEIGRWMDLNGESIYGTQASPFATLSWGRCTQKSGKLYLHIFELPQEGVLRLPALKNQVHGARLLAVKNSTVPVTQRPDYLEIDLGGAPEIPLAELASVVVLEIDGPVQLAGHTD
jgi:alpha-L-fucosidase